MIVCGSVPETDVAPWFDSQMIGESHVPDSVASRFSSLIHGFIALHRFEICFISTPRESLQPSLLSAREMEDLYLSIKTFGKCFLTL